MRRVIFTSETASSSDDFQLAESKRILAIDALRGLAAMQVVMTHIGRLIKVPDNYIRFTNCLTRYEVPLFLIISGALLCNQLQRSTETGNISRPGFREFWVPKIKRVFIPYVLCSAFISIYYRASLDEFFGYLIFGDAAVPYYFVAVLFQCYLLIYIFPKYFFSKYCLPAGLLISMLCLFLGIFFLQFMSPFVGAFLAYFCYGCCHQKRIAHGRALGSEDFKSILLLFALMIGVFFVFPNEFNNFGYFYPIAIFEILLKLVSSRSAKPLIPALNYIGSVSLWIFLVHYGVVRIAFDTFNLENLPFIKGTLLLSIPLIAISVILAIACERLYRAAAARIAVL